MSGPPGYKRGTWGSSSRAFAASVGRDEPVLDHEAEADYALRVAHGDVDRAVAALKRDAGPRALPGHFMLRAAGVLRWRSRCAR